MKNKKLNLQELKITSFVTSLEGSESLTYKGKGATACCISFEECPSVPVNNCGIASYNACPTLPVGNCEPFAPQHTAVSGPYLCLRPQPHMILTESL